MRSGALFWSAAYMQSEHTVYIIKKKILKKKKRFQDHPQLHSKLKASLKKMTQCLTQRKHVWVVSTEGTQRTCNPTFLPFIILKSLKTEMSNYGSETNNQVHICP
ncbi:hypothetical protein LEMLEM_LOCUS19776, partial [Lemmus lemmus]